ncbi:ER to Golgi transport-related protein [Gigaspora margarita]|uniref:ER to Golgi transport-related protein n=1 Tax=Gigaspora margarita TaxID=4874 RepID=A0A8H4ACM2_GIGMA|nr:ER to Golgi transport-related protein [Gigaspora margarita]
MTGTTFANINEELAYYKNRVTELEETLNQTQAELDEVQTSARDFEEELLKELEQSEKTHKELRSKNESLKIEVDEWKQKFYQAKSECNVTATQLQREIDTLQSLKDKFIVKTRELELDNDDLERTERAAKSSLQDLENKYNKAIERNAILENEIEGKNQLIVQVQRLKDELRDVNIELAIMKNKEDGEYGPPQTNTAAAAAAARKSTKNSHSTLGKTDASLDPNSNPVKMVQEMVGRVKSLEARLVSCRSLVTPLLAPPPSYSSYSTTMPLHTTPPQSPKFSRGESPIRNLTKHRRPSIQKSPKIQIPFNSLSVASKV